MASITCGHCKQTHSTVAEVRRCANPAPETEAAWDALKSFYNSDWKQPAMGVQAAARGYGKTDQQLRQVEARVPAGRYAVEVDGMLRFYVVDKPTEGKWAGYTFVKVQASDDLHPVRVAQARLKVLSAIALNPHEAMLRYGREIGKCGHCGRTLTNDESRAIGIGPVCARSVA